MAVNNIVKRIQNIMRQDAGVNGDAQRIEQMTWMFFLKVYDTQEETWEYKACREGKRYTSIIPEELRWRNWAVDEKDGKALTGDALLSLVNDRLFPTLKNIEVTRETPRSKAIVKDVFEDINQYMKNGTLLRQVINVINEIEFDDAQDRHLFGDIYEGILKDLQSAGNAGEFYTPRALTDFIVLSITNLLLHDVEAPNIRHCDSLATKVTDFTGKDKVDVIGMNPPYGGSTEASVKSNFPMEMRSSETADLFMVLIMYRLKAGGRAGVIVPDGFLFGTDGAKLAIKTKMLKDFNLHTVIRLPGSIFSPYTPIATNILFFNNEKAEDAPEGYSTKDTWFYRLDMPEGYKHFSKTKSMKLEHCNPIKEWWNDRKEIIIDDGNEKSRYFSVEELIANDCNFDLCKFPKDEEEILPPAELLADYYKKRKALDHEIDKTLAEIQRILGIEIDVE